MTHNYYEKHKERQKKKHAKNIKIYLKKKKTKAEEGPDKYIKMLLRKREKASVSL